MHTARIVFTVIMALVLMGCPPPVSDNPDAPGSQVNDSTSGGNNSTQNGANPDAPAPVRKHHVAQVFAGDSHSMILKTDDTLWAVGNNDNGQLGDGDVKLANKLTPVQIMTKVKQVSASDTHTMILKKDDTLWAVGKNNYAQLGDGGKNDNELTPVKVLPNVKQVSSGSGYTMILKNDDTLWAVGNNNFGQLGDGDNNRNNKVNLVQVRIAEVDYVSVGTNHSMIVKKGGTLWGTGFNLFGQLGDGSRAARSTPVQVMEIPAEGGESQPMTAVAQVAAGNSHSMILKKNDSLWSVGNNDYGQLGDGTQTERLNPVQVMIADDQPMTEVAQVSAGMNHTMILKRNGELWAVGRNNKGQLGDGSTANKRNFVQVMEIPAEGADPRPMTAVAQVSAGENHSMIVKRDGTLWAVGANGSGQLGNNGDDNLATRLNPEQITPVAGCHDYLPEE